MLARIRENIARGNRTDQQRREERYQKAMKKQRMERWARAFGSLAPAAGKTRAPRVETEEKRRIKREERLAALETQRRRAFEALSPAKLRQAATTLRLIETGELDGLPLKGLTSAKLLQMADEKEASRDRLLTDTILQAPEDVG